MNKWLTVRRVQDHLEDGIGLIKLLQLGNELLNKRIS